MMTPDFQIALAAYEQTLLTHTPRWTKALARRMRSISQWCAWYAQTYGEALSLQHLDDAANGRRMAERFREHCHRHGSPEAYRRKRQHIRAYIAWCITTGRVQADPFEAVLPTPRKQPAKTCL
jgi:site-specific recombinase XerC